MHRSLPIIAVVAVGAACASPPASAAPAPEVLITVVDGARLPAGAQGVARIGGLRFATVAVPAGVTAERYAAALTRRAGVVGAEPDTPLRRAYIGGTCVDTPASLSQDLPVAVNARSRSLPRTTGAIAVLDTGVDPTVPELQGRVLPASEAIAGTPPAAADNDGHGTQVAAAAAGAPGLVAGVSPTSPIMPIRIATASALATPSTIVKGLEIAVTRKARVALLPSSRLMRDTADSTVTSVGLAISAAFRDGVITVVPSGNEGEREPVFPGTLAHVITVGSAAVSGARDAFSNFGPWIDLVAPSAALVMPAPPAICISGYARADGTSFSAAAVAGAIALIGGARPTLSTSQLYDVVRRRATSDASTSGFDVNTGFGLLNVGAGLGVTASAADPYEINDNVYWLRQRPAAFPTYLRSKRKSTTRGSLSPGKDPQDAFKVRLRKGELLRATVKNGSTSSALAATIWSTRAAAFSMELPASSAELRDSSGFTQNPAVSYRASKTGTYYVAVFAPDWDLPGEQGKAGQDLAPLSPPRTTYSLTLARSR